MSSSRLSASLQPDGLIHGTVLQLTALVVSADVRHSLTKSGIWQVTAVNPNAGQPAASEPTGQRQTVDPDTNRGGRMRCSEDLPPEIVAEVASILAAGYLKYRRSLAIPTVSAAEPSANRLSAAGRKPPVASRPSPWPRCMSPTAPCDSGNLRISRVDHPRYSRRHPLSALQKTKQRTDASYISGSSPQSVRH